jgi:hypothetical protein
VHTGLSGVTAEQRLLHVQRSSATAFNALQCAPESEHAQLAHRTVYRTCSVHHRTAQRPHKSELQRSNPNGLLTWLAHRTVSGGAPDCPVSHRTVRCASGAMATSRAMVVCNRIQCATVRARVRARAVGAPDSLQDLSGAPPDSPEAPQVRAPTVEPQRSADVAGAPDSVRWRTGLSSAPCDSTLPTAIFWWLGL